jgi:hypothetical protein
MTWRASLGDLHHIHEYVDCRLGRYLGTYLLTKQKWRSLGCPAVWPMAGQPPAARELGPSSAIRARHKKMHDATTGLRRLEQQPHTADTLPNLYNCSTRTPPDNGLKRRLCLI